MGLDLELHLENLLTNVWQGYDIKRHLLTPINNQEIPKVH